MKNESISVADRIAQAVRGQGNDVALTATTLLRVADGQHGKIKPPIFQGKTGKAYGKETRLVDDKVRDTVFLDTPQSGANRLEHALWQHFQLNDDFSFPQVFIHSKFDNTTRSILQMPHRYSDAHVKNSLDKDGVVFRDTPIGVKLYQGQMHDCMAELLKVNPFTILLGAWHSFYDQGTRKELHHKFHRCILLETVATVVGDGVQVESRLDPVVTGGENEDGKRVSEEGIGNIPPTVTTGPPGGVSTDKIWEQFTLSFHALRYFRTWKYDPSVSKEALRAKEEDDAIAREMLVWMGIVMYLLRSKDYFYRSGCSLQPITPGVVFKFSGSDNCEFTPTLKDAISRYNALAMVLEKKGLYDRKFEFHLNLSADTEKKAKDRQYSETKKQKAASKAKAKVEVEA